MPQPDLHPLDDDEFEDAVCELLDDAEKFMDAKVRPAANSAWAAYWDNVNVEPEEGGSDTVVPVVRDVAHSIMPDLMEILAGNEAVVEYVGRATMAKPGQLPPQIMAEKATLLAQDVFWQDCKGWPHLHDALLEGVVGNEGCLKVYQRQKLCLYEHQEVEPDPLLLEALNATPGVAVADPVEQEDGSLAYPIKKYQVEQDLLIEAVPASSLVHSDACDADSALLVGERMELRRGGLVAMGIEAATVGELGTDDGAGYRQARERRQNRTDDRQRENLSGAAWAFEPVTAYKLFVQIDSDGDGLPERWEVLLAAARSASGAGKQSRNKVLRKERVEQQPYCIFAAHRSPDQVHGRTLEQVLGDMQDQRTAVIRDTLDNARLINSPMMLGGAGVDAAALANWRKHKFVKETVSGSIRWWQPPPTVQYLIQVDQLLELQQENRTGQSRVAMGLDPDALTNVTATAIQGTLGAAQRKQEMTARTVAEVGMKPLFQKLLRYLVGMPPRLVIGTSGGMELVSGDMVDPTFSVRVRVGIGPAAKMARTTALRETLSAQMQALAAYGPGPKNPFTDATLVLNSLQDLAAQAGLRADRYWKPPEQAQQILEEQAQQGPPPDPKMIEVQGKLQQGQQKQQFEMQAAGAKFQADAQQSQHKALLDYTSKMQELQAKARLEMQKLDDQFALRLREQNIEGALEREKIRHGGGDANIPRN